MRKHKILKSQPRICEKCHKKVYALWNSELVIHTCNPVHKIGKHGAVCMVGKDGDICVECKKPVKWKSYLKEQLKNPEIKKEYDKVCLHDLTTVDDDASRTGRSEVCKKECGYSREI